MFEIPFAHRITRKIIIGFGQLFSKIKIQRFDNTGAVSQVIQIPIAYGPKEKFIQRVDGDPDLNQNVYITLPRLSFEILSYTYDAERKVNRNNKIVANCSIDGIKAVYAPVPYNLDVSLYLMSKGAEDGLAVVEQILPLFSPEYTMKVNMIEEMGLKLDVPVVFNSATVQDDYEGSFDQRRLVTHTFNFTIKLNYFGPTLDNTNKVITRTDTDLPNMGTKHTSEGDPVTKEITLDEWSNE